MHWAKRRLSDCLAPLTLPIAMRGPCIASYERRVPDTTFEALVGPSSVKSGPRGTDVAASCDSNFHLCRRRRPGLNSSGAMPQLPRYQGSDGAVRYSRFSGCWAPLSFAHSPMERPGSKHAEPQILALNLEWSVGRSRAEYTCEAIGMSIDCRQWTMKRRMLRKRIRL